MPADEFDYLKTEPLRSGENRLKCPACSSDRKSFNQHTRTLQVRDWGDRITYHCWHCGEKGAVRKGGDLFKPFKSSSKPVISKPPPKEEVKPLGVELSPLNRACYEWLEDRGISKNTADLAGLRRGNCRGDLAVGFPYLNAKGEITGYKLRSIERKTFGWEGNATGFFLGHMIDPAEPSMIIHEGEMDALSSLEAGLKNPVSLPHGSTGGSNPDDAKLACLSEAGPVLKAMKKIVVATDNDGPGRAVAAEIKRRVGLWRSYSVQWPEDCKDANDALLAGGPDLLRKIILGATPESIPGLTKPSAFKNDLMRFRRGDVLQGYSTGLSCIDHMFRITPGVFTTITGHPGHGKSEFVDQVHVNMAVREGWNFGIWSRENAGFVHVAKLIEKFQRKRFHHDMNNVMNDRDVEAGFELVEKHATFITSDGAPDTMETILDRMTGAVMRDGIKSCVIDPYNYISKNPEVAREDLQISDMLSLGTDWAKNHECHVFFVAHPRTMDEDKVPSGSSISGGCYSDDTECLTKRGWVLHQDLRDNDEVAVFNPDDWSMHYETPEHRHVYDHDGKMHHWLSEGVDLMVTPNHRMLVCSGATRPVSPNPTNRGRWRRWREDGGLQFMLSDELPEAKHFEIPRAAKSEINGITRERFVIGKESYPSIPFWWYAGFWVAEGCMQMNGVSVCQLEENSETPIGVMRSMDLSFYSGIYIPKRKNERPMWTGRVYQTSHPEFCAWIPRECGEGCQNKKVPDVLFTLSAADKRAFLDGLIFGDGTHAGDHSANIYTTSAELANGVQRLAVELGIGTRMFIEKRTQHGWKDKYVISLSPRKSKWIIGKRHKTVETYTGKVYCLTVSTGAYFVRRNGIVSVCGNSTFNAKTDFGLSVHRPGKGKIAELHNWKTRHSWLGRIGVVELGYRIDEASYYDLDMPDADPWETERQYKGAEVIEFEIVNGGRGEERRSRSYGSDSDHGGRDRYEKDDYDDDHEF